MKQGADPEDELLLVQEKLAHSSSAAARPRYCQRFRSELNQKGIFRCACAAAGGVQVCSVYPQEEDTGAQTGAGGVAQKLRVKA